MGKMVRFGFLPLLAGATLLLAVCGNVLAGAEPLATAASPRSAEDTRARVNVAALGWPLRFEENVGQVKGPEARNVRYVSRRSRYTLFLTSTEAVLDYGQRANGRNSGQQPVVLRMRLSGGNYVRSLTGMDELTGKSNYFIGNDPSQWHTGVANYARVAEKGVYPGIDLVYHGHEGQLEYDFEVAPEADPGRIRLALEGAQGLRLDPQGDLLVKVRGGELRFRQPVAYQATNGAKRLIPVRYMLKGKNQVEFRLAAYDRRQPLVIDPILAYSTYLGGSSIDSANGIAVAPDGTTFIAGGTFSANFPTVHALQPNAGGPNDFPQDAFVSKISADGSTLVYSTYLGGGNQDVANGIAVDAAGEAFVVGTTFSPHFPVTAGSINVECGGDGECGASWNPQGLIVSNAFVAKLNTAGSGLVYSTFLGYYEDVEGYAIAVDSALNAYVTGATSPNFEETVPLTPPETPPPPFPTTSSAFEATYNNQLENVYGICTAVCSGTNAFITKIDAPGDGILYSSYLGGDNTTYGYGVAVDNNANAYVTGLTYSDTGFPLTLATALQATNAGAGDAFLTKVNTTAATGPASLAYSTYLGGTGLDQANAVAVDTSGDVYITGATTSLSATLGFTPPPGGFQTNCTLDTLDVPPDCKGDAFVAKFNPTLSGSASLLYFTYLGGALADSGTGIAVDASGNIFITGSTVSTNFPIAGAVFQPNYGGGNSDAFVTELNPANPPATALIYSTYLGGSNTDVATGIAVDTSDAAYVSGQTCSLDFPLSNPEQPTYGGNCDAFVSKIIESGGVSLNPAGLIFASENVGQQSPAQTVTLTNGANVALAISGTTLTGDDSGDFAIQSNTCVSSVPPLGTCAISVTFTPTSITPPARTAKITFTDTETGGSQATQVIDLTGTAGTSPIVSLSPANVNFSAQQAVGVTSTAQILTVTNTGTAALTISSIVASGDFAQTNNCTTAALQATTPPSNCTISVTFTPNVGGQSVGSLTLTDNAANSPQVILLTGTAETQPIVSLSASTLTFGSQPVNTTSAAQTVTVTNTGSAPLSITSITAAGPFGETNTCALPVAPTGICTISVTYTPTTAGSSLGTISLVDNANSSPQVISLTGGGADFGISINPTSATVVAGNATNVTVGVSSVSGFSAATTITCTGLPTLTTCSASPATVTPSGTGMVTSSLTISTTRRTSTPPGGWSRPLGPGWMARPGIWFIYGLLLLALGVWARRKLRLRWSLAVLAFAALWLASFAACGSGGTGYVNPTGTPAGTYTISVTGTSGGLSHSTQFTLTVQ
ncbi:MAG: SBBP repeat-containing protein [Terriglobia bacterium]